MAATYPVSILEDGPAFTDELAFQNGQIPDAVDGEAVESLYLVPTKSAAKGVFKIFFQADDRHWALVRLARRYRWVLEVQLLRGMSGERQLLNQGFTVSDLEFFQDILPRPDTTYSTVVYDMLWTAAAHRSYLALTKEMTGRLSFTPREIIEDADGVSMEDTGLFSRFLRSHLITPVDNEPVHRQSQSDKQTVSISVTLDELYKPTTEGKTALLGIVDEYERVFESQEFAPLLVNPDLDPLQHFKAYEPAESADVDVPTPDLEETDGLLGDIAGEFIEDEADSPASTTETGTTTATADGTDTPLTPAATRDTGTAEQFQGQPDDDPTTTQSSTGTPLSADPNPDQTDAAQPFSNADIIDGVVAAVRHIQSGNVVRTSTVKDVVWDAVEMDGRDRGDYWELVRGVLMEVDSVHGRPEGRVWLSGRFTHMDT